MDKEDLIDELKVYLQSIGWDTNQTEIVVDGIVESFDSDLQPEGFATYDELAKNQGIGTTTPFDEKAIALLDQIKQI